MSGFDLATAGGVLKEFYLPGVREQLNNDTFIQMAEKNTEDIQGEYGVLGIHLSRNSGVGSRADGAALPTAGNQSYTKEHVPLKYHYARIRITGPTIKAMASDQGSFVRAVRSEMDGATNDLKRNFSRQLFGTSNGVIAKTGATTSSTTVTLAATRTQARQLEPGFLVDIGTVASPTAVASALTIMSVTLPAENVVGGSMVVSSAVTTTTSDSVSLAGAGGITPQNELTGLQTIVNSNAIDGGITLFNVDASTYPIWQSYVDDNGGVLRSVTELMFSRAQQEVRIAGGANIDVWVTSAGAQRAYASLLTGLKRFPGTVDLKGGYQGLTASANGVDQAMLVWDRDCPSNTAFGLRSKNWMEFRMSDWDWFDLDGSVLHNVPGYDAYEAILFKYAEMMTDKRNAHGRINDITES